MIDRTFETREVAELLGVAPRRVEGWVERGLLEATRAAEGPGTRRQFSVESVIAGMILLRVQTMVGERDESVKWLIPKLPTSYLAHLLDQPRAEIPYIALAVINYAGANYAGALPNAIPRGEDQYQVDVALGRDLASLRGLKRPVDERPQAVDRRRPDARTWDEALHEGASVTFFDVTRALLTLKERLEGRTARD